MPGKWQKILFYTICPKISSKTRMPGKWQKILFYTICPKISSKTRMPGKWGGARRAHPPPRSANAEGASGGSIISQSGIANSRDGRISSALLRCANGSRPCTHSVSSNSETKTRPAMSVGIPMTNRHINMQQVAPPQTAAAATSLFRGIL